MDNFRFYSPTEFVFGKNTEKEVGTLLKKYHAKKVFIHYGGGSIIKSGLLGNVLESLKEQNIDSVLLGGALPNPRSSLVYEGIAICKKEKVDFVLAVGGGSAIDSAKAIAAGAKYDGDFWDFYDGKASIQDALPVGVVLTIPAAGSEGSQSSVITKEEGMLKRGIVSKFYRPVFSIINPELTYTLPWYHTAAGIVDMMSHIFERYLTKSQDVILTDRLAEATLVSIIEASRVLLKDPNNYEARATICWAGTIAHNGVLGVGRQDDWSTHGLEHELSALYDVTHGAGLAVMFPAFMRYTVNEDVSRYVRLANKVFNITSDRLSEKEVALMGIDALEAFYQEIKMPTSFKEINALETDIDKLLEKLKINRGEVFGSFKKLTLEDARNIYKLACK